jgi:hypothetical protein
MISLIKLLIMKYIIAAFLMFFSLPFIYIGIVTFMIIIDKEQNFLLLIKSIEIKSVSILMWLGVVVYILDYLIMTDDNQTEENGK